MATLSGTAFVVTVLGVLGGCATSSSVPVAQAPMQTSAAPATGSVPYVAPANAVCMIKGPLPPNIQFSVVGSVEGSKEFYGSVNEILPLMADEARKLGGDVIINLETHQRVGLWAWAHPVGNGTAIKLGTKTDLNCLAAGGSYH